MGRGGGDDPSRTEFRAVFTSYFNEGASAPPAEPAGPGTGGTPAPRTGRELRALLGAGLVPSRTPISSGVPGLHVNNRTAEQEMGQKLEQKVCFPFKRREGDQKFTAARERCRPSPLSQKIPFQP